MTQRPDTSPAGPGSTIGPYRLVHPLGAGGMGTVYLAEHLDTGRTVALKTVRAADERLLLSLRREIRALARLQHPGIVRILDEGAADGLPWYAMELVEGSPLVAEIPGRTAVPSAAPRWWTEASLAVTQRLPPLPRGGDALEPGTPLGADDARLAARLTLVRRMCGPLAFLHGEGLVHRDLKPDNVIVRAGGRPVLVDFGLVAHFDSPDSRETLQATDEGVGTAWYMAPEQIKGGIVDARADLYALGCILHELLVGRPPFVAHDVAAVLWQHVSRKPAPPSDAVPGLPAALDELVLALLAKDPRDRPGHAGEVAEMLEALGAEDGIAGEGPAPRDYLYRPALSGRERESEILRAAVEGLALRRGGFVLLQGDAGVGKTRLALEAASAALRQGLLVLLGSAGAGASAVPLLGFRGPFGQIADRCRIRGRAATRKLLGTQGRVLASFDPSLSSLPGIDELPEPPPLPDDAAAHRLRKAVAAMFQTLADDDPTLLLVDDGQGIDLLGLEILELLRQATEETPLLVVVCIRPEGPPETLARLERLASPVRVGPLSPGAIASLVGDALAAREPPRELLRWVQEASGGNPLFASEYLRVAVQQGFLRRNRGGWQALAPAAATSLPVPRTLRELAARTLELVPDGARRILARAAFLRGDLDVDLLAAVTGAPEGRLLDALALGLSAHVLEEPAAGRLAFAHGTMRAVAAAEVPESERAEVHRRAAVALEARPADHVDALADLAGHWEDAGSPERARPLYFRAARQAVGAHALDVAGALYRRGLALAPAGSLDAAGARLDLARSVLGPQGRHEEATAMADAACATAVLGGDRALHIGALAVKAQAHWTLGNVEASRAALDEALSLAEAHGDRLLLARVLQGAVVREDARGRADAARAFAQRALALVCEDDPALAGRLLLNLAAIAMKRGMAEEATARYQEALATSRQCGDRVTECGTLINLGILEQERGRFDLAESFVAEGLALARSIGHRVYEAQALSNLGVVHANQGRLLDARARYTEALAIHREVGNALFVGLTLLNLASADTSQAAPEPARERLDEAIRVFRELGHVQFEGRALLNLGELEQLQGRAPEARAAYVTALARFEQCGDLRAQGLALLSLARLDRLAGAVAAATGSVDRASDLLGRAGDDAHLGVAHCERGQVALLSGGDAAVHLEQARRLADAIAAPDGSTLRNSIAELEAASAPHPSSA